MNLYIYLFVSLFIGIYGCENDAGCPTNSTCVELECQCDPGFLLSSNRLKCLAYVTEYHGSCTEDPQCEWLGDHSKCESLCVCEQGYRWFQGKCSKYSKINEPCTNPSDCFDGFNLQSLTCTENKCVCNDDYYLHGDSDCRKIAANVGDLCMLDVDCKSTGSTCYLGTCMAPSSSQKIQEDSLTDIIYYSKDLKQETKSCSSSTECSSDQTCFQGGCVCDKGYFSNGEICIPELGFPVVDFCKSDEDCPIKPGKCDASSGTCYCRDYYFTEDGNRNCIKSMSQNNFNCLSKEWCYALGKYSYCASDNTCKCSSIANLEDFVCKLTGDEDEEECDFNYQCNSILKYGECVDEHCKCNTNDRPVDKICLPNIGATCNEERLCTFDNATCLDSICTCNKNFVAHDNNCYPVSSGLGGDCIADEQCLVTVSNTKCISNQCRCSDAYVRYEDTCWEKKDYGSYCVNEKECKVSLGDSFVCRSNKCQCATGMTLDDERCSSGFLQTGSFLLVFSLMLIKGILMFC